MMGDPFTRCEIMEDLAAELLAAGETIYHVEDRVRWALAADGCACDAVRIERDRQGAWIGAWRDGRMLFAGALRAVPRG